MPKLVRALLQGASRILPHLTLPGMYPPPLPVVPISSSRQAFIQNSGQPLSAIEVLTHRFQAIGHVEPHHITKSEIAGTINTIIEEIFSNLNKSQIPINAQDRQFIISLVKRDHEQLKAIAKILWALPDSKYKRVSATFHRGIIKHLNKIEEPQVFSSNLTEIYRKLNEYKKSNSHFFEQIIQENLLDRFLACPNIVEVTELLLLIKEDFALIINNPETASIILPYFREQKKQNPSKENFSESMEWELLRTNLPQAKDVLFLYKHFSIFLEGLYLQRMYPRERLSAHDFKSFIQGIIKIPNICSQLDSYELPLEDTVHNLINHRQNFMLALELMKLTDGTKAVREKINEYVKSPLFLRLFLSLNALYHNKNVVITLSIFNNALAQEKEAYRLEQVQQQTRAEKRAFNGTVVAALFGVTALTIFTAPTAKEGREEINLGMRP